MTENQGGSCEPCKKKKCKCDRQLPSCTQCSSSNLSCGYNESNKRGIPTGYLGLLEHRLSETESLLYFALSELQALTHRDERCLISGGLESSKRVYREVSAGKKARMEEWRRYSLGTLGEIEIWRRFVGGEMGGVEWNDEIPNEPRDNQNPEYFNRGSEQSTNPDPDPGLLDSFNGTEADFSVAAGLIGLSQNHNQTKSQQFTNTNSASSQHQSSVFPDSTIRNNQNLTATAYGVGYPSTRDIHTHRVAPDPNHDSHPKTHFDQGRNVDGQSLSSGSNNDSGASPSISHHNTMPENPSELPKSQQLSAAFSNVYY